MNDDAVFRLIVSSTGEVLDMLQAKSFVSAREQFRRAIDKYSGQTNELVITVECSYGKIDDAD